LTTAFIRRSGGALHGIAGDRTEPRAATVRSRRMNYLLAAATLAMMGYMLGVAMLRMRRDRVLAQRHLTRGKFAFRPRERLRLLLNRAFRPAAEAAEWEDPLLTRLSQHRGAQRAEERSPR
jgi:hypothetical protein